MVLRVILLAVIVCVLGLVDEVQVQAFHELHFQSEVDVVVLRLVRVVRVFHLVDRDVGLVLQAEAVQAVQLILALARVPLCGRAVQVVEHAVGSTAVQVAVAGEAVVVTAVRVAGDDAHVHLQPVEEVELVFQVEADTLGRLFLLVGQVLLIVGRKGVFVDFRTAAERDVVLVGDAVVAHESILDLVVAVKAAVAIHFSLESSITDDALLFHVQQGVDFVERLAFGEDVGDTVVIVVEQLLLQVDQFGARREVQVAAVGQRGELHTAVIAHAGLSVVARTGGDDDDAVGRACTVDGGGCGIFQHSHIDDVSRIEGIQTAFVWHAVDHVERASVAVECRHTADFRYALVGCELHTGHHAFHAVEDVGLHFSLHLLRREHGERTGGTFLGDGLITGHDHFVELAVVGD